MKTLTHVFAVVGLLALGYWTFVFASARLYQARETQRLTMPRRVTAQSSEARLRESPVKPIYPSAGSAVALLAIPRLGLSAIVVEGADESELSLGPGHIPGTPLPGGGGNVGVAGHRDTFFRPLRNIRIGDSISVVMQESEYHYKVISTQIVEPDDIRVLYPTSHEELTLVTCYPFDFVGAAPKRFIVHAARYDRE